MSESFGIGPGKGFFARSRQNREFLREGYCEMSLGIWKKLAALLSVICISAAVNGCGPAAETPTAGDGTGADASEESTEDADEEAYEEDSGTEDEGSTALD